MLSAVAVESIRVHHALSAINRNFAAGGKGKNWQKNFEDRKKLSDTDELLILPADQLCDIYSKI